jgi:muramidase (phage lysozyme)
VTRLATITQPNLRAFMDMIALSEIGAKLLAASDDGYNVLVGGQLFSGYADHPRKLVRITSVLSSTAAGRYQLLARYFNHYKAQLHLPDFSPDSQDAICLQQIREQHALTDIVAGNFEIAVQKVANIWASLPGSGYGQHENTMAHLRTAYLENGGMLA